MIVEGKISDLIADLSGDVTLCTTLECGITVDLNKEDFIKQSKVFTTNKVIQWQTSIYGVIKV